jgi:uncharacterized surface protein with fasciclin (FAS1) repeats
MCILLRIAVLTSMAVAFASAFCSPHQTTTPQPAFHHRFDGRQQQSSMTSSLSHSTILRDSTTTPESKESSSKETRDIETFLRMKFPAFYSLLIKNENVWKQAGSSATFFAPNAQAFEALGEKKRKQLEDPRNLETAQKMGLYHIIPNEIVTNQQLRTEDWTKPKPADGSPRPFTVGGIVTLGGQVPVGRSKSGGMLFGWWGATKEDEQRREAVVGPNARIVQSYEVDGCMVHEMDALISPQILWRYCDQLRIPGF